MHRRKPVSYLITLQKENRFLQLFFFFVRMLFFWMSRASVHSHSTFHLVPRNASHKKRFFPFELSLESSVWLLKIIWRNEINWGRIWVEFSTKNLPFISRRWHRGHILSVDKCHGDDAKFSCQHSIFCSQTSLCLMADNENALRNDLFLIFINFMG